MAIDINIVEWLENWFTKKGSETRTLSQVVTDLTNSISGKVSVSQGNENASKNIVTNSGGTIVTQPIDNSPTQNSDNMVKSGGIYTALDDKVDKVTGKGLSTEDYTSSEKSKLSGIESGANNYTHPTGIGTAQTSYVFKKIKYDSQGHITATTNVGSSDLPSHEHDSEDVIESSSLGNIGTSNDATQHEVNIAINNVIGNLSSIQAIQIVSTLPTASASTMGKLYIISENSKINVYYTTQSGNTYSWHPMDTDILDEYVVNWSDVQGRPTKTSDFTNDGADGTNVFVASNDTRLTNARTPTSHASTGTTYGVGTTSNYGHNKIRDNLTASTLVNGESLSAHQGYVLKGLIDDLDDTIADFDASNIDFDPSSNMWGEYVQVVDTVANGLDTLKEITNALNTSLIGKQDTGECITSIALIPYNTDNTGKIRLYFGDEP